MKASALFSLVVTALAAQPSAPSPKAAPVRDLPWGQLNFLHTTDTHGWHGGHLQEPSFSADWGDYISFASHLRDKADQDGVDLLLIDTGDRVEGNGLYDASRPRGNYTFDIFKHQQIDVICSGNHELYKQSNIENELFKTVPDYKGNYLASNIDVYNPDSGKIEALAPRFKKFTTRNQGIRVTAFGFLYNFNMAANGTVVQPVEDAIKEEWFLDAIRDRDVDLFLVTGHVAVRSDEYDMIYKTIRKAQWDVPIQFFGGHTHIRDYKKYDRISYAIESGRFMETVGFMSISGLSTEAIAASAMKGPTFGRRYIDNNLFSYHHHTGLNESTFPTELGQHVSQQITEARKELNLDHRFGCAPKTFWLNRAKYDDENSIFSWLSNEVMPEQFKSQNQSDIAKLVITNTGAIRFDIFEGPYTRDITYQVSPFTSGYSYISNVTYDMASRVLELLNSGNPMLGYPEQGLNSDILVGPEQLAHRRKAISEQHEDYNYHENDFLTQTNQQPLSDKPTLTPGYTTKDDAGTDGDDTEHSQIVFYDVPNCMQTEVDFPKGDQDPETVNVIYNEFLEPFIFLALEYLGKDYNKTDTAPYLNGQTFTEIISDWVGNNWPCEKES